MNTQLINGNSDTASSQEIVTGEKPAFLEIRVHAIDGSARTISQSDAELAERALQELDPAQLFSHDRITIADGDVEITFVPPLIARIDLVTDRLSVWDFPFVLGAPVEITEAEFTEGVEGLHEWKESSSGEMPVFLEIEMLDGERLFLSMRVVAGLPSACLKRVHSLFKERRLIFGLQTNGIGILNHSNVVGFSVRTEHYEEHS
jgi:hypothetical protein